MSKNTKALKPARELRRRMTRAEKILWQALRNGKLGIKFRRQMPFVFGEYHFVADFYCSKERLIIEIDGGIHDDPQVKEYDKLREDIFRESGYIILRFKNGDIYYSLKTVLSRIKEYV